MQYVFIAMRTAVMQSYHLSNKWLEPEHNFPKCGGFLLVHASADHTCEGGTVIWSVHITIDSICKFPTYYMAKCACQIYELATFARLLDDS